MFPYATLTPEICSEPCSVSVVAEMHSGKGRASAADQVMRVIGWPLSGSVSEWPR